MGIVNFKDWESAALFIGGLQREKICVITLLMDIYEDLKATPRNEGEGLARELAIKKRRLVLLNS